MHVAAWGTGSYSVVSYSKALQRDTLVLCTGSRAHASSGAEVRKCQDVVDRNTIAEKEQAYLAQNLRVSEDNDTVFGPCKRDVQPPGITQESDPLMFIAPDATKNNVILLATLEGINASDLDLFVELFLEGSIELHVGDDIGALAFIRCDDPDLVRRYARLEELSDDLLDV